MEVMGADLSDKKETNSRKRLKSTLAHKQPDRVCVDFGSTAVTGIAASMVSKIRKALLGDNDWRVKIIEPYQVLGEIDDKLCDALGIDVMGATPSKNLFGFANADWKPFTLFDGTEALIGGNFNVTRDESGGWLIYPEGDTSVEPSGHMPNGGFYFDAICRQEPINESKLNVADNLEEFCLLDENEIQHFVLQAEAIEEKGRGCILSVPGSGFGDIALVPAMWMKHTKGIRDIEEWYISTITRRDYVYSIFERQCEIALQNIEHLAQALGSKVDAAFITGTDFGMQTGPFISPESYRDLYKPFHEKLNDFIHKHTTWKTFIHSCGSVVQFIPEFIDAGFDILNPVQCSAVGMDPKKLKNEFGKDIVFWGGGVDTQKILPFATPQQVYDEVRQKIDIFNKDGGFVFNGVHNIQATVPLENVLAMFRAVEDSSR